MGKAKVEEAGTPAAAVSDGGVGMEDDEVKGGREVAGKFSKSAEVAD